MRNGLAGASIQDSRSCLSTWSCSRPLCSVQVRGSWLQQRAAVRTTVVEAVSVEPASRPGLSLGRQPCSSRPTTSSSCPGCTGATVQHVLPPGLRQRPVLSDLGMLPSSSITASVPLSHPEEGSVIWGMATHFRHLSPGGWRVR